MSSVLNNPWRLTCHYIKKPDQNQSIHNYIFNINCIFVHNQFAHSNMIPNPSIKQNYWWITSLYQSVGAFLRLKAKEERTLYVNIYILRSKVFWFCFNDMSVLTGISFFEKGVSEWIILKDYFIWYWSSLF